MKNEPAPVRKNGNKNIFTAGQVEPRKNNTKILIKTYFTILNMVRAMCAVRFFRDLAEVLGVVVLLLRGMVNLYQLLCFQLWLELRSCLSKAHALL